MKADLVALHPQLLAGLLSYLRTASRVSLSSAIHFSRTNWWFDSILVKAIPSPPFSSA